MKYTNRADLLEAAAKSIRMQEAAECMPVCKCNGITVFIRDCTFLNWEAPYEFPLAVVEGKPVFVGDELYFGDTLVGIQDGNIFHGLSWNPPKPKTVLVEIPVDVAEEARKWCMSGWVHDAIGTACRKALEEQK